ncbi:MAG: hypothetical protein IPI67_10130 [Myxococcales bacterium]|nr:hypothetical protein [Myxococcales bacterium]
MVEPLRPAIALSALVHALVFGLAMLSGVHRAAVTPKEEAGASVAGDTFDIDELIPRDKTPTPPALRAPAAAGAGETEPSIRSGRPKPKALAEPRQPVAPTPARPRPAPKAPAGETTGAQASAAASAPKAEADAAKPGASESASANAGELPKGGTAGTERGVADLAKAFAKAVTAATHKDPIWEQLPLGAVGSIRVTLEVDAEGHIEKSSVSERDTAPTALIRLVERTLLLLKVGRFALSGAETKAGTQALRIAVELSAVPAEEDFESPKDTVKMGFEPPRPGQAGRSYFVHAGGRRFDASISVE